MTKRHAFNLVWQELLRAEKKHPQWPHDHIHAAAVVAEESGELVRAALRVTYEGGAVGELTDEATQTAATAIRFLLNANKGKCHDLR